MTLEDCDRLLDEALAAHEAGRLDKAEALCREILEHERDVSALHLLGVIAGRTGRRSLAIESLREAVALEPESPDLLSDLCHLLRVAGEVGEAIAVGEKAMELDPHAVGALNNLGQAYLADGRTAEAIRSFEGALVRDPTVALVRYNLGCALQAESRDAEATAAYEEALALDPNLAEAHARLGSIDYAHGNVSDALAQLRRASAVQPDSSLGLVCRAAVDFEEGRVVDGKDCLIRARAVDPENSEVHARLGDALSRLGKFDEANASFEASIALSPRSPGPYASIVANKRITEADRPLISRIETLLAGENLNDRERSTLHFALGKAANDLAQYETAMRHYDEANRVEAARLRRAGHVLRPSDLAAAVDSLVATYTPELFSQSTLQASSSERPILIVGMPRSGTTLIEQIVSSHPQVGAGDELTFWVETKKALILAGETQLTSASAERIASDYLARLEGLAPGKPRVTDKMPQNFLNIGLIHQVFPRARIIHSRRDAIDTCLSIYFTNFAALPDLAFDRVGIVAFYEQYLRAMAHWRATLPAERFLEVDYEALVEDPEPETRRMIAFCGLEWDEACLRSERNERVIKTASMWQARQPVYKTSVERWRRYEPWLGEFRRLMPYVK
jgi:tetratricopeptide (TPR) repeat protein